MKVDRWTGADVKLLFLRWPIRDLFMSDAVFSWHRPLGSHSVFLRIGEAFGPEMSTVHQARVKPLEPETDNADGGNARADGFPSFAPPPSN